jgi:hypothetical protein
VHLLDLLPSFLAQNVSFFLRYACFTLSGNVQYTYVCGNIYGCKTLQC